MSILIQGLAKSSNFSKSVTYKGGHVKDRPGFQPQPPLVTHEGNGGPNYEPNDSMEPHADSTVRDNTMILIGLPVCAGVALLIVGCIIIMFFRY